MDLSLLPCTVGDARPSDKRSMGKQFGGLLILISHSKLTFQASVLTSRTSGAGFAGLASGQHQCTARVREIKESF